MRFFRNLAGWAVAFLLWLWTAIPRALDRVGRTTLPDDWDQLVAEKLPLWAGWLFSTPWWVPALLATILTGWMMWISWPRPQSFVGISERTNKSTPRDPSVLGKEADQRLYEAWDGVDPLTMTQAAFLWAGEHPDSPEHLTGLARARYITLAQGIETRELKPARIGIQEAIWIKQRKFLNLTDIEITREAFEAFINKKQLWPAPFIFKNDRN